VCSSDLQSESIRDVPQNIGYSEIDKYAINTYEEHFTHDNYGDATKINPTELPGFDLLVGGFPCQAFSVAGKRLGFNDTRGTLFFDIARILAEKRPRHLVLENVKGLLSHDGGKTFETIIGVLADLGYFVEWQVLNSKDFGVPQNRERVFIVGHLGGEPRRKVFPITDGNRQDTQSTERQGNRPFQLLEVRTEEGKKTRREIRQAEGRDSTKRGKDDKKFIPKSDGLANCITTGQANIEKWVVDMPRIRRLTPLECERLQGFPDNWTVGSDTQRYKQCGNAVTVNVVTAVIGGLYEN
jgi:DNA (cytosine-5)-methyltransferase 1